MPTRIATHLYPGDALDAELLSVANPENIEVNVNVASEADEPLDGIINIHVPMDDGEISAGSFDHAIQAISEQTQSGRVLVHCEMGISRAAVVVALFLAVNQGISLDDALTRIKKLRHQIRPTSKALESAKRYLEQRSGKA